MCWVTSSHTTVVLVNIDGYTHLCYQGKRVVLNGRHSLGSSSLVPLAATASATSATSLVRRRVDRNRFAISGVGILEEECVPF